MEGLRDRINEVRDHYRLSNRGFAEAIGAKPAATNNYLNGTKEPSLEFVDKILSTYVDVSAEMAFTWCRFDVQGRQAN